MITSKENESIKKIVKLMSSAKYRTEQQQFIAEGVRLCRDAAESSADIKNFLYTHEAKEKYPKDFELIAAQSQKTEELSPVLFRKITDTKNPQGFLCVIKSKENTELILKKEKKYIALENIQDPSNMGTILRTAEALGVDGILLSSDCCDIYSPKVVRGSMGAVFRIHFLISENFTEDIRNLTNQNFRTFASTPRNAENIQNMDFSQGAVILIGNEANGLKAQTIEACSQKVKITMLGRAESLNASAAAAILIYELMKS